MTRTRLCARRSKAAAATIGRERVEAAEGLLQRVFSSLLSDAAAGGEDIIPGGIPNLIRAAGVCRAWRGAAIDDRLWGDISGTNPLIARLKQMSRSGPTYRSLFLQEQLSLHCVREKNGDAAANRCRLNAENYTMCIQVYEETAAKPYFTAEMALGTLEPVESTTDITLLDSGVISPAMSSTAERAAGSFTVSLCIQRQHDQRTLHFMHRAATSQFDSYDEADGESVMSWMWTYSNPQLQTDVEMPYLPLGVYLDDNSKDGTTITAELFVEDYDNWTVSSLNEMLQVLESPAYADRWSEAPVDSFRKPPSLRKPLANAVNFSNYMIGVEVWSCTGKHAHSFSNNIGRTKTLVFSSLEELSPSVTGAGSVGGKYHGSELLYARQFDRNEIPLGPVDRLRHGYDTNGFGLTVTASLFRKCDLKRLTLFSQVKSDNRSCVGEEEDWYQVSDFDHLPPNFVLRMRTYSNMIGLLFEYNSTCYTCIHVRICVV